MKPIRFFRHVACESPGYLGTILTRRGVPFDGVCLDEGVRVHPDPGGVAMQFHLEMTPESISGLVERYSGDLRDVSDCVQSAETITAELAVRTRRLYRIADVVFGRWVAMIKDNKIA